MIYHRRDDLNRQLSSGLTGCYTGFRMGYRYLLLASALIAVYLVASYGYFFYFLGSHYPGSPYSIPSVTLLSKYAVARQKLSLVFLGDSLTAGVGVSNLTDSFPYLLSKKYLADYDEVELVNYAVPGAKARDVLDYQLPKTRGGRFDMIFLMVGTNDVLTSVTPGGFRTNFQRILDGLSLFKSSKIVVINIPYLTSSRIIFPPYNLIVDWRTRQFNGIIDSLAVDKSFVYVDLYSKSRVQFRESFGLLSSDRFHPNATGYKLWSDVIYADTHH